jgi:hypothetical protein
MARKLNSAGEPCDFSVEKRQRIEDSGGCPAVVGSVVVRCFEIDHGLEGCRKTGALGTVGPNIEIANKMRGHLEPKWRSYCLRERDDEMGFVAQIPTS